MEDTRNRRKDAIAKVTGSAKYANDLSFPGMLFGSVVRAEVASAHIISLDVSEAKARPGVVGVLTAADIPGIPGRPKERPVFCADRVRCMGDPLALIVAETRAAAESAVPLVRAEYEMLPAVFTPEEALRSGAPALHEGGNQICRYLTKRGDAESAIAASPLTLERSYQTSRVQHVCLETETVVAVYDAGEQLCTVYCPVNSPFPIRRVVADTLGCPLTDVRIVLSTIGGSFGGKNYDIAMCASRAALAAYKFRRPCKICYRREESIIEGTKRHPITAHYRAGFTPEGRLTALQAEVVLDGGAYTSKTHPVTSRMAIEAAGPYRYEAVDVSSTSVYTNNVYSDALRGFGSPQVDFCSETFIDEIAASLSMDPLDFRRRNLLRTGDASATGQRMEHVSLEACLDALETQGRYAARKAAARAFNAEHAHSKRGVGIALLHRGESFGAAGQGLDTASGMLSIQPDCSVSVMSGIADVGQGGQAMLANLVHEALGVPRENIRVGRVDTSYVTDAGPTVATRGTVFSGGAVCRAAEALKQKLASYAEKHLGTKDVLFENGRILSRVSPETSVSLQEVVSEVFAASDHLNALGYFYAPPMNYDKRTGTGDAYLSYVYGASLAEVTVDTETGAVTVEHFIAVHDLGHAFDKEEVRGQITGGVSMGVGYALFEEVDMHAGAIRNTNYESYIIPTALDMPHVETVVLECPGGIGPLGAKGIGEPAACMIAPAILNAIADASGKRIRALPADLERVLLGSQLKKGV